MERGMIKGVGQERKATGGEGTIKQKWDGEGGSFFPPHHLSHLSLLSRSPPL